MLFIPVPAMFAGGCAAVAIVVAFVAPVDGGDGDDAAADDGDHDHDDDND